MNQILFFASVAAMIVGTYLHVTGCLRFPAYGQSESNPLWMDKYGFFSMPKYLISMAVYFGAVFLVVVLTDVGFYMAWIPAAIMAAGQFVFWMVNTADAKRKRAIQVDMVNKLRAGEDWDAVFNPKIDGKAANPTVSRAGRVWYRLFPWLYVPGSDQAGSVGPLREKVAEWASSTAQLPE